MKKRTQNILMTANKVFLMILGSALVSVGLEFFLLPNAISDGGITGLSIMAAHITKLPLGLFILTLNLPFLVLGYKKLGKVFTISTLFSVVCLSIGVSLLGPMTALTEDILLATIFGGIILGVGVGLIIRAGGSLDGTEIVSIIVSDKSAFSIGEIVMFINFFILGGSGFIFGWDRAMYSLITYYIAFKTIDITVEGLDESKSVVIVSEHNKEISKAIAERFGRGYTLLEGKGSDDEASNDIVYVVVSRLEIVKLKSIVHEFDKNALIAIASVEATGKREGKGIVH